ncbi:MAG: hypothetical protein ACYDBJ_22370, partial [Aggregatilineales bacterium]
KRSEKGWEQTKQSATDEYNRLNAHATQLYCQGLPEEERRRIIRDEKQAIDTDLNQRRQAVYQAQERSDHAFEKYKRASIQQRELLRDLDTLAAQARAMFELDNAKDQIMSILKLALVNVLMWTRDHCFPASYAQATTPRLLPFFRLPGRILTFQDRVLVTLRPFNDRALNRDLAEFCQRVNHAQLCLPNGKLLLFHTTDSSPPISNLYPSELA